MLLQFIEGNLTVQMAAAWFVAITIALTVHEFAHAKRAQIAGDETAHALGRVSLNPLDHYDPVGTTMILLFGIGWGKPVPVNPLNFKRPRWDSVAVAAWGAGANIITAAIVGLPIRFGIAGDYLMPLTIIMYLNLMLAFFNLLPLGPLDGSAVVQGLLPVRQARRFAEFSHRWGFMLLMLIIIYRPLAHILIWTPVGLLSWLITGRPLFF
jgi:Zn-dependent protease